MNSKIKKSVTVFMAILVVSSIGYATVYGYGGGSSSRSGSRTKAPVVTVPAAGLVLGESTFAFTSNLSENMQSEDVKQLQERLRAEGFFTFPTSTGYFGPITRAAVIAYQQSKGIVPAVGFVGPITRAALNM